MKKSLIALAALAATSAFAQSSVTLYGIVEATTDIGYNRKVESVTSSSFTSTSGAPVGTSTVLSLPTIAPATGLLTAGAAVNGGTVVVNNQQKNGMRVQDGSSQGTGSSRVGFRGTEDLGGGMKANFTLEMGLRIDDGCTTLGGVVGPFGTAAAPAPGAANNVFCNNGGNSEDSGGATFGRNAWGGLSGGFGEVRVGRQVVGSYAVQTNSWAAGSSNGLYDAGTGTAPLMGGVRFSNAIRYMTPNFGGFTGSLMLAAPETAGNTSANSTATPINTGVGVVTSTTAARRTGVDLALEYANGPAYVGFGYNVRDAANVTGGFTTNNAAAGVGVANAATPGRVTAWTLGGSYDLGVVKPFLNYTRQTTTTTANDAYTPVAGGFAATIDNSNEVKVRAYSIGLRAPVGAFTIIAGYGRVVTDGLNNVVATQNVAAGSQTTVGRIENSQRRNAFQLGAQYALSKRTLVEANYGYNRLQNNTNAQSTNNFLAASGVQTIRASDRISALNVGLKHSF